MCSSRQREASGAADTLLSRHYLSGYGAIALLAGGTLAVLLNVASVGRHVGSPVIAAVTFALAAAWQLSPFKRRALVSCHGTVPLAPRGWRANRDCVRYGWTVGGRCLVSCAGLMLACVFAGHSLIAMIATTAVAQAERRGRVDQLTIFAALVVMSAIELAASWRPAS